VGRITSVTLIRANSSSSVRAPRPRPDRSIHHRPHVRSSPVRLNECNIRVCIGGEVQHRMESVAVLPSPVGSLPDPSTCSGRAEVRHTRFSV
jgi:hypothetical protein